jgi:hypothetical protein
MFGGLFGWAWSVRRLCKQHSDLTSGGHGDARRRVELEGKAGLWMRIDGKEKTGLAFDNMMERPVKGTTDWKKYEVVLDVPAEAEEIFFGFLVAGKGRGWVDDIKFEVVNNDVPTTALELKPMERQRELTKDVPKEPTNVDFETE